MRRSQNGVFGERLGGEFDFVCYGADAIKREVVALVRYSEPARGIQSDEDGIESDILLTGDRTPNCETEDYIEIGAFAAGEIDAANVWVVVAISAMPSKGINSKSVAIRNVPLPVRAAHRRTMV